MLLVQQVVSYSIGQIDFQYSSSADYSVSEGVQQTYSFDTALSIDDIQYDFQPLHLAKPIGR